MAEEETQTPEDQQQEDSSAIDVEEDKLPDKNELYAFSDIKVKLVAVLGSVSMPIEQFLKLGRGAIIELKTHKDDYLHLRVNNNLVAQGEITIDEDQVNVTVKSILKKKPKNA